jgi:hypothetical protein
MSFQNSSKISVQNFIKEEIENHPAWLGNISGIKAEKLLSEWKKPYLYVLRAGENEEGNEIDYYVTYISDKASGYTVRHQPFTIIFDEEIWACRQGGFYGPYQSDTTCEDILHLIMHCESHECVPLINSPKKCT